MTVTYATHLDETNRYTGILFRWSGSIYKLIWIELLSFLLLSVVTGIFRAFALKGQQKRNFDNFCNFCLKLTHVIPIAFILPFFVRLIITRRFEQFLSIPWIDRLALYMTTFVQGTSEYVVMTRRTVVRYMVLSMALCFKTISSSANRRFHSYDVFVETGLATQDEIDKIKQIDFRYNNYFVPMIWATEVLRKADRRGIITGERCIALLINEITVFHEELQSLFFYDWINVPLVYTQVSTICTYVFFIATIFGDHVVGKNIFIEYINKSDPTIAYSNRTKDYKRLSNVVALSSMFPLYGLLQFGVYIGWLKVAESMINPYGDDDEDFEMVGIIQRNLQVGYLMVDKVNSQSPLLTQDVVPIYLQPGYAGTTMKSDLFTGSQWKMPALDDEEPIIVKVHSTVEIPQENDSKNESLL